MNTKRILVCLALTCLIVLLSASFALAGEKAATDMPSDEALTNAVNQLELAGRKVFKGYKYVGYNRIKDRDNAYQLFFEHPKWGLGSTTFELYKINTGKWVLAAYAVSSVSYGYVE